MAELTGWLAYFYFLFFDIWIIFFYAFYVEYTSVVTALWTSLIFGNKYDRENILSAYW